MSNQTAVSTSSPRLIPKLSFRRRLAVTGFLFVLPALAFFALFAFWPMINAFYLSFFKYDLLTPKEWVGIKQYVDLFQSRVLIFSNRNSSNKSLKLESISSIAGYNEICANLLLLTIIFCVKELNKIHGKSISSRKSRRLLRSIDNFLPLLSTVFVLFMVIFQKYGVDMPGEFLRVNDISQLFFLRF